MFQGNTNIIENQTDANSKRQWRKVLYDKQQYPDNYIDEKRFLESLQANVLPAPLSSSISFIIGTTVIFQQLSIVAIFVAVYKYVMIKTITLKGLISLDLTALLFGYITEVFLTEKSGNSTAPKILSIQAFVIIGVCLRIAAPILQTLTSSFSDDTINALSIFFTIAHLIFHDYSFVNGDSDTFAGTISLNAAMFSTILLISRIKKIELVFAFVVLAVICFSLFPHTAKVMKKHSLILHILITAIKWIFASFLLYKLDIALFIVYEILVALVVIIGPIIYMKMLMRKKYMRGPWDIPNFDLNSNTI